MLLYDSNIKYDGFKNITEKASDNGVLHLRYAGQSDISYSLASPFDEILANPEISGLIGLQILGRSEESNITIAEVPNFCTQEKRELVDDFSGTVIRKKYLEQFLIEYNKNNVKIVSQEFSKLLAFCDRYIENTTDTKFMDFIIEKTPNGNISSNPTVFHRIKSYRSEWM